jgi:hypothetical protein
MIPLGTTLEFEYLGEFEIEIKNILEHESGAHMGLIHEKNQKQKISRYCTFNTRTFLATVGPDARTSFTGPDARTSVAKT